MEKNKHNRHHSSPNQHGVDPDVDSGVLSFTSEATDARTGLRAKLAKRQGYFFSTLLFLEGFYLHYISIRTFISRRRWIEMVFIGARHVDFLIFVFLLLPPGMAAAFIGVQVGLFGFLLGGAFAPNHIGMPTVSHGANLDFLRRQVLMSCNIRGGFLIHFFMGGAGISVEEEDLIMSENVQQQRTTRCCVIKTENSDI